MSNDRLKAALSQAGMEVEQLAELGEVDVKTAQRWLAGRVPYSRKRLRIAKALRQEEADLWPELAQRTTAKRASDLEGAWAHPNSEGAPDWLDLIQQASVTIELCDYSLIDVLETPGAPQLLQSKAATGMNVRLMIASLQSLWITLDDWPPDTRPQFSTQGPLTATIAQAHNHLLALIASSEIQARQAIIPRCPAIRRFDNHMLIALPLWGTQRHHSPILQLEHHTENGLFDTFTNHFQALWQTGWPLDPDPYRSTAHDDQPAPPREPLRQTRLAPYGRRPPKWRH